MIAVTVGVFAFAPWKVMSSASSIVSCTSHCLILPPAEIADPTASSVTVAGSYGCVLAPMASVMAADYFFVKHRKIDVPALYDPHGIYYCKTFKSFERVAADDVDSPQTPTGSTGAVQSL